MNAKLSRRVVAGVLLNSIAILAAEPFGKAPDGRAVELYTLTNSKGAEARIATYGGTLVSLKIPDRGGKLDDVVLGFDSLAGYLASSPYFGALVGRYGNRIAKGAFTLDGKAYKLAVNNAPNHLHGGVVGFDKRVWTAKQTNPTTLLLTYTSADGEEGYPGKLSVTVTYSLTTGTGGASELKIEYSASTDKPTVVNLTHHSYFNLAGQGSGDVLGHQVTFNADRFLPTDSVLIPTGELRPVAGTAFDFRQPHTIGERIHSQEEQIKAPGGYDQNFVLARKGAGLELAAKVVEPKSGRVMEVLTTEPGLQFYTANGLSVAGKGGKNYGKWTAFCMETQHYPDSPNQPAFPSTVLRPGQQYHTTTVYRFTAQ